MVGPAVRPGSKDRDRAAGLPVQEEVVALDSPGPPVLKESMPRLPTQGLNESQEAGKIGGVEVGGDQIEGRIAVTLLVPAFESLALQDRPYGRRCGLDVLRLPGAEEVVREMRRPVGVLGP